MTVALHLKPEVEAGLVAQAQASGMDLEAYLLVLVEEAALSPGGKQPTGESEDRAEAVRRMLGFSEKHHLSLGEPIKRALLHEGHRF
jgi:hypothetical protein